MRLVISLLLILFFVLYSICYFSIGRVCYNSIKSLEESVFELNSLETGMQCQIPYSYRYSETNVYHNNNCNSAQAYNPKFQVIKLLLILKFLSIIIIPFIEILPINIFLIFNYFIEIHSNELVENICYWIWEFSPLTNSLMILFLHRETREELYK
jgi:hypothetical protein